MSDGASDSSGTSVRRVWSRAAYVAYLCAALVAFNFAVHHFHVAKLRDGARPDMRFGDVSKTGELARQLGGVSNPKSSFYSNFPTTKRPGVVRVGCFGDSFTAGNEVGDGRDYPALLQQVFKIAGLRHVEVINFGLHWTGFQQAYMVWEEAGRHYDLDFIVVGPLGFLLRRDLRFNHAGAASPYYLHSRFVLKDSGVERIDVIGDTFEERFETYQRFVPSLRYLRYDREPPAFLAALLPGGRSLENPFYYTDLGEEEEARSIWAILMERMADSGVRVVVGNYQPSAVETANHIDRPNVAGVRLSPRMEFPYRAPEQHNSPMGNLRVARQVFAALTGDSKPIPFLEIEDLDTLQVPDRANAPLDSFEGVELSVSGEPLGYFGEATETLPDYFRRHQIKSLLAVRERGTSWLSSFFVGLPIEITDEMASGSKAAIQRLHPNLALWTIDVGRVVQSRSRPRRLTVSTESTAMLGTLELGGEKWFDVGPAGTDGLSALTPKTRGGWLSVSADPRTMIDERSLRGQGVVDLVLKRSRRTIRFPISSWQRRSELPPPALEESLWIGAP